MHTNTFVSQFLQEGITGRRRPLSGVNLQNVLPGLKWKHCHYKSLTRAKGSVLVCVCRLFMNSLCRSAFDLHNVITAWQQ